MIDINELARVTVDAAFKVHSRLGPGLLESVYEVALAHEMEIRGYRVQRQLAIPVVYDGIRFDEGFRADLVIDGLLIVELKSVEKVAPVHKKQLLTLTVETFFANFGHLADAPNGVQKLRELILQLAVQGKLVPQDPTDEPASVLLERVEAERRKLTAAKEIRDKKIGSFDDEPYELPASWSWVPIGSICRDWGQKVPDKRFSYIDVSAIDNEKGAVAEPAVTEAAV